MSGASSAPGKFGGEKLGHDRLSFPSLVVEGSHVVSHVVGQPTDGTEFLFVPLLWMRRSRELSRIRLEGFICLDARVRVESVLNPSETSIFKGLLGGLVEE